MANNRSAAHPPLIIHDPRRPGQVMASCPLKLPTETMDSLRAWAEKLQCTPTAVARALLRQGLEQLEQTTTQEVA